MPRVLILWFIFHAGLCYMLGPDFDPEVLGATFVVALIANVVLRGFGRSLRLPAGSRKPSSDVLEEVLYRLTDRDSYTLRDLTRNLSVFGGTGSGKSTGAGYQFGKAIAFSRNTAMLILASKPEDKEFWSSIFAEARRELLVVAPGGRHCFGVLDHELKAGGDTRDITQCLMTLGESLGRGEGNTNNDPFWKEQNRRMLHNAIEVVKLATGRVDPWILQQFIVGAARAPAEMAMPEWRAGPHSMLLKRAHHAPKGATAQHDYDLARLYWTQEIPALNDRTRSSIEAGVMGLLHVMNVGLVRELIAGDTTVTPKVLEEGTSILINMPIVAGDATATFVNTAWKYAVQRHILRRKAGRDDRVIVIWSDEFQKVANSYDAAFLAECRSHRGCLVALTQSIPGMFEAIGANGHAAKSLLSNFLVKVFHAVGDPETAEFASSLLGNRLEVMTGGSTDFNRSVGDEFWGGSGHTGSFNSEYQPILQPNAFATGLRTGGPPDWVADAYVIKSGQPFASGEACILVPFAQPPRR